MKAPGAYCSRTQIRSSGTYDKAAHMTGMDYTGDGTVTNLQLKP